MHDETLDRTTYGIYSPTNKPENKELLGLLHTPRVMCMISVAPTYDKLKDASVRKIAYQEIIKGGADVIKSGLPIEVAEAIQNLHPREEHQTKVLYRKSIQIIDELRASLIVETVSCRKLRNNLYSAKLNSGWPAYIYSLWNHYCYNRKLLRKTSVIQSK